MGNEEILKRTAEGMKEGNRVLIKELIRDLEEKGISPVIAVEGEVKNLQLTEGKELENFQSELQKMGLEKSDFCLLEEDQSTNTSSNHSFIIVHKKSGKIKQYKNTNWLNAFHHDLADKFFTN
jgi:hypothetical protein